MVYSGIGSRSTPQEILEMMTKIASKLETMGYILRSGGAKGCDNAFSNGISDPLKKEIYRPEHATKESIEFASHYHPAWHKVKKDYDKKLHGRNSMIILGMDLELPSDFCITYTLDGECSGGSGQGMQICNHLNIPIFNLFYQTSRERLEKFLGS